MRHHTEVWKHDIQTSKTNHRRRPANLETGGGCAIFIRQ
jgi:hypothetical protein